MFSRKTLALISSLIIVLVALFVLSYSTDQRTPSPAPTSQPQPTPVAQTVIQLSPNPVSLTSSSSGTVDITMDTSTNEVTAVQVEILYDPKVLTNVSIRPGTFFTSPVPLLNTIDREEGRISYALAIAPAQAPLKGSGTVATIVFSKNAASTATQTELKLLPRTLVAAKGVGPSVLKSATGTTITLSPSSN